jgi:hypothetical protein
MASPIPVRATGRTAVVSTWLAVLAVAGRPVWLAVLLGLVLVGVWASPLLSATTRRAVLPAGAPEPAVRPREAGPG